MNRRCNKKYIHLRCDSNLSFYQEQFSAEKCLVKIISHYFYSELKKIAVLKRHGGKEINNVCHAIKKFSQEKLLPVNIVNKEAQGKLASNARDAILHFSQKVVKRSSSKAWKSAAAFIKRKRRAGCAWDLLIADYRDARRNIIYVLKIAAWFKSARDTHLILNAPP